MIETVAGHLYDYPKYYDLVFGSDWKAEYDFLRACFNKHARRSVERLFEPACGTGRLMVKLADAGYKVSGNDLNAKAVEYCNARLERRGFPPTAVMGDMADFCLPRKADAAFNMINSFRHLTREEDAQGHLECIAGALGPGGIYVLGLHLTPTEGEPVEEESWSARRGNLAVLSRMWQTAENPLRRTETYGMSFDVYTPTRTFRLTDEVVFRTYTAPQMQDLVDRVDGLEIAATYDFAYDTCAPIEVVPRTQDVVYVFERG